MFFGSLPSSQVNQTGNNMSMTLGCISQFLLSLVSANFLYTCAVLLVSFKLYKQNLNAGLLQHHHFVAGLINRATLYQAKAEVSVLSGHTLACCCYGQRVQVRSKYLKPSKNMLPGCVAIKICDTLIPCSSGCAPSHSGRHA